MLLAAINPYEGKYFKKSHELQIPTHVGCHTLKTLLGNVGSFGSNIYLQCYSIHIWRVRGKCVPITIKYYVTHHELSIRSSQNFYVL